MSTYFLADGGPRRAGDTSSSELATAGAAAAFTTGAVGMAASVAASARPRAVPRPPPRRSMTLADLRLRLRSVDDSAAHQLSIGLEADGGGGADGGNVGGGWEEPSPLANSAPFKKHEAAAYTVAGEEVGSVAGGSLSGIGFSSGGSRAETSSQRRLLTVSVAPAEGTGPPRRPSVATPPSPGAGFSE